MFGCISVIIAGLVWLLYECDWLRLRMVVGPTRDYHLEAIRLVTQHEIEATNAIKRATAQTERDILALIECSESTEDVLHWARHEIGQIEKEFGDRLCPYRNASRGGRKGGHDHNPYAYPFYGITGPELDAKYATYRKFTEGLALRMEEVA